MVNVLNIRQYVLDLLRSTFTSVSMVKKFDKSIMGYGIEYNLLIGDVIVGQAKIGYEVDGGFIEYSNGQLVFSYAGETLREQSYQKALKKAISKMYNYELEHCSSVSILHDYKK